MVGIFSWTIKIKRFTRGFEEEGFEGSLSGGAKLIIRGYELVSRDSEYCK